MSKKTKATSKRIQRLTSYNNIISKNRSKYKAGFRFSRDEFISAFGLPAFPKRGNYATMHKASLKLVAAQQEINELLRESGMYLKSTNYYSEFVITKKEPTKGEITRYSAAVDRNEACTARLADKMEERGSRWGTYLKVPARQIASLGKFEATERHEAVKTRLTHF